MLGNDSSRYSCEPRRVGDYFRKFGNRSTNIESAASIFKEHGHNIAGVVTEAVQGAGGVFPPPDGFLEGLVACAMTTVLCSFLTKSLLDLEGLGTGSLPTPTT